MFPRIGYMAQRGDVLLACVTAVSEVGGGVSVGQELVADGMGKHGGQFRIGERLRAKAFRWIVGGRQSVALPGAGYPLQLRRSMTSPRNQCHGAAHLVPGTGCCGLARTPVRASTRAAWTGDSAAASVTSARMMSALLSVRRPVFLRKLISRSSHCSASASTSLIDQFTRLVSASSDATTAIIANMRAFAQ